MDKSRVTFEMINGNKHFYELNGNIDKIYSLINNCPDGWIEVKEDGETHYLKAEHIVRVRAESKADFKMKQEESINKYGF